MAHGWIVEVLTDLHSYAISNGLRATAAKAAEALEAAQGELAGLKRGQAEAPRPAGEGEAGP